MKAMIVDDDLGVRLLVKTVCEQAGVECVVGERGEDALALYRRERPDVIVLDVMMPRVDGFEACRRIRAVDEDVPVLFLSAKGDVVDKKTGFAQGADDYLVKPFDEDELLVRMQALVRRAERARQRVLAAASAANGGPEGGPAAGSATGPAAGSAGIPGATSTADASRSGAQAVSRIDVGPFSLNFVRHEVLKRGAPVALAPKEFQILFCLAQHHGDVIGKDELITLVWGEDYLHDALSVAVYVRRIRAKIEDDPTHPAFLRTVRGVGYVFEA